MRRRVLTALIGVLAVTAGCATTTTGPDGTTASSDTPGTRSTTELPTYDTADDLPGVADGVVVDETRLIAGNERALADRSYVATRNWTYRFEGSRPSRTRNATVRVSASGDWRVRQVSKQGLGTNATPYARLDAWSNGTVGSMRTWNSERGVDYRVADVTNPPNESLSADFVGEWLASGEFTHERTVRSADGKRFVFTADGYDSPSADAADAFSGRLVIDERGQIRSIRVSFVTGSDDDRAQITFQYDLRRKGPVTVLRPDWIVDASERDAVAACRDDTADYECTDRRLSTAR